MVYYEHLQSLTIRVNVITDDFVLCETSREKVEQELEKWRDQFERHGLRISRTKTEYIQIQFYKMNAIRLLVLCSLLDVVWA